MEMTEQELGDSDFYLLTFSHVCMCKYECVYAGGTGTT